MESRSSTGFGSDSGPGVGSQPMETDSATYADGSTVPTVERTSESTAPRARPTTMQSVEEIPVVTDETGERVRESFQLFLDRYVLRESLPPTDGSYVPESEGGVESRAPVYVEQLYAMRDLGRITLYVDFSDVLRYDEVLARAISDQYYRCVHGGYGAVLTRAAFCRS